jgi:hypothetical protein
VAQRVPPASTSGRKLMSRTLHQHIALSASRLLQKRQRWSRNHLAVDAEGNPCAPRNKAAVQWCMRGALIKCAGDVGMNPDVAYLAAVKIERRSGTYPIIKLNDGCSFRRMRATMRKIAATDFSEHIPDELGLTDRQHQNIAIAATQLLSKHQRWTRHGLALDAKGKPCEPISPQAVRWCMMGALAKCAHDASKNASRAYLLGLDIARKSHDAPLHLLNQTCDFHQVRAAMQRLAKPDGFRLQDLT